MRAHDSDHAATLTSDELDRLRDIQSITDAALSVLDPQTLLDVLVDRVKEALRADTSAILLLDRGSGVLIATAASGLEEEVQQGVRIPVGAGFAGRIAALGRPVVLDAVDHTTVVNPILLDKGIKSLMGAPLLAGGRVLGVLHVGTLTPRAFTGYDADLLQIAADRAALAVQALTVRMDRATARTLQTSLLPSALPALDGLSMAARYVPGTGNVGGDWYDVFPLPSGAVCAVIGDVAGSGLKAAVIMGRMRSSLRSYALETEDPAEIIGRLDRKMRYFEPDAMATVLCAIIPPARDHVLVSSAGHLPPIVAARGQAAAPAPVTPDLPVGVAPQDRHQPYAVDFPPGAVLCLYTDGLVERRDRPIDDGIARLCAAVSPGPPDAGCAAVMAAMDGYRTHADDVALLLVHRESGRAGDSGAASSMSGDAMNVDGSPIRWVGRHAVVTVPAELDITNNAELSELLASVIGRSAEAVTADMTSTTFCDSAGVHVLARAWELASASGAELRIALSDSPATRVIQLVGLDQVIPIYRDVQQSLDTPVSAPDEDA